MIKKPNKIPGDKIFDNRGSLSFVNSFGFNGVKRFYLIQNHQKNFIRAWHAHKKEEKYFFCVEGSCQISCVAVNNFKNPNKNSKIHSWVLSDQKPEIIFIPKGYANGSMNFSINTKILVFSSSTLQQSASDDYRYPFDYWNPWSIIKKMKKILIFGSTGMLGSEVLKVFANEKNFIVTATYRNKYLLNKLKKILNPSLRKKTKFIKFDVTNYNTRSLKKCLGNNQYIINCIGVIKPYIDEKNKKSKNALLVNSIFPHNLNEANKFHKNAKIYQIATDCVFSGSKRNYLENSEHDALDIYGKTKSLGEVSDKSFFNIRCSIIGNEIGNYKSLVEWFKMQKKNSKLNGFSDHLWNGITTYVFAEIIKTIIIKKISLPNVTHIIPKNKLSKFELLKLFKKILNRRDIEIKKVLSNKKIDRTLDTIHPSLNRLIWKKSIFKKCLNMKNIVDTLIK